LHSVCAFFQEIVLAIGHDRVIRLPQDLLELLLEIEGILLVVLFLLIGNLLVRFERFLDFCLDFGAVRG
jgi:hypothetical protein